MARKRTASRRRMPMRPRADARLLAAVPWEADTPGDVSPADIRRATGVRKIDVANDLDGLRKHGEVRKVSKGLYVRTGPAAGTAEVRRIGWNRPGAQESPWSSMGEGQCDEPVSTC